VITRTPSATRKSAARSRGSSVSRSHGHPLLRRRARYLRSMSLAFGLLLRAAPGKAAASPAADAKAVAALDTAFQLAVKRNDVAIIDRILGDGMVLVTGRGQVFTKAQHLEQAKAGTTYEQQDEVEGTQQVRLHGDTAIVTALLWIKGTHQDGKTFDYKVWFSDTYIRTPTGWKYIFGQSSIPLPKEDAK